VDSLSATKWQQSTGIVCTENYGRVMDRPASNGNVIVDLVPGARLKRLGSEAGWVKVETPSAQVGYVQRRIVMDEKIFRSIHPSQHRIVSVAKKFLGIPYLWGGTSTKGFDCSGFVQTVYRLNNISLPRDANQIVNKGNPINPDPRFNNLQAGDMLFFGSNPDRITHCAIYLGDRNYIHSSGWVRINSFDPEDPGYNKSLHEILRAVKRVPIE
jgi:cell wall-associated NlpC family hydrolase